MKANAYCLYVASLEEPTVACRRLTKVERAFLQRRDCSACVDNERTT
jgi:hypothetical protein